MQHQCNWVQVRPALRTVVVQDCAIDVIQVKHMLNRLIRFTLAFDKKSRQCLAMPATKKRQRFKFWMNHVRWISQVKKAICSVPHEDGKLEAYATESDPKSKSEQRGRERGRSQ